MVRTRQSPPRPCRRRGRDRQDHPPRWVSRVLATSLTGTTRAQMRLVFDVDLEARDAVAAELFGKCLLVIDHEDWTIAEVVATYRSQSDAEQGFRSSRPHVASFSPMFHWTDQKPECTRRRWRRARLSGRGPKVRVASPQPVETAAGTQRRAANLPAASGQDVGMLARRAELHPLDQGS